MDDDYISGQDKLRFLHRAIEEDTIYPDRGEAIVTGFLALVDVLEVISDSLAQIQEDGNRLREDRERQCQALEVAIRDLALIVGEGQ